MKTIFAFMVSFMTCSIFGFIPMVITIPKSGTHMAKSLAMKLTKKKEHWMPPEFFDNLSSKRFGSDYVYFGHCLPTKLTMNVFSQVRFRVILMVRDPRDQILSFIDWIYKKKAKPMCNLTKEELFEFLLINPQIRSGNVFESSDFNATWEERYRMFLQWADMSNFCLIRYEDLVGPKGGGSLSRQKEAINKIADHLGITISNARCVQLANNLYGGTLTFNKAIIERWKSEFTPEMTKLFCKWFSDELIERLGYQSLHNLN